MDNEIVGNIKLRLDKDLKKLLKTSEKTGVPLRFSGDSILDLKLKEIPVMNPILNQISLKLVLQHSILI